MLAIRDETFEGRRARTGQAPSLRDASLASRFVGIVGAHPCGRPWDGAPLYAFT